MDMKGTTRDGDENGLSVPDLLVRLTGVDRLARAEDIDDGDVEVLKSGPKLVEGVIRGYRILIDSRKRIIRHGCEDWAKGVSAKRVCKHVGKLFLVLPEAVSVDILSDLWEERDRWKFEVVR